MASEVDQLHSRTKSLAEQFEGGGESRYIEEAIDLARQALELCPPGHPKRSVSLTCLAFHLNTRYSRLGDIEDINEAVSLDREALLYSPGHSDRSYSLNILGIHLSTRYDRLGTLNDLEESITLGREVLLLCPPGHPLRSYSLDNLGVRLSTRYDRLGTLDDLEEAITLGHQALLLRPLGHPDRSSSLDNLGVRISARYDRLGKLDDLEEAIMLCRKALLLRPPGHPFRSHSLHNLGVRLSTRYDQLGIPDDLEEAITLCRDALLLRPSGHPLRSSSLNNLSNRLSTRYDRLGILNDLEEAIELCRDALFLCPPGHPLRSSSLNNLGNHLSTRYDRLGTLDNLEEAIMLGREALLLRRLGHPDRPGSLDNLGKYLSTRHDRLGTLDDLEEAILLGREALLLRPPGHPLRSSSLDNLGVRLSTRYNQLGTLADLEEAIMLGRDALCLRPSGHPLRSSSLDNLGVRLSTRYDRLGTFDDLEEAITLSRDALLLRPSGHPLRSSSLNNLGNRLSTRYNLLGTLDNLEEAIALGRDALLLCPPGHPTRPYSLYSLASRLSVRYTKLRHEVDQQELFTTYMQLSDVQQTTSLGDLSAARAWITVAERFQHSSTLLAYGTALRFLVHHLATLPVLPQHLKSVKNLVSSLAMDAFSASIRSHDPTHALELLEQGRAVFWGQLAHLNSSHELADVAASGSAGKALADEFSRVTSLIRGAINSPGPNQHDQVCNLNVKLQVVISEIRRLPHLSRFLLPPAFSNLQRAASGGPVIVVNASAYGCDALIVLADQDPVHVSLSAVTKDSVRDLSSRLRALTMRARSGNVLPEIGAFLRELWDMVVSPIVDKLRSILPLQSRIWWCPTAEFTLLPLHAAGPCRQDEQNLSDLYVSSYTPTLTALIRARQLVQPKPETRTTNGDGCFTPLKPALIPLKWHTSSPPRQPIQPTRIASGDGCFVPISPALIPLKWHASDLPSPEAQRKRQLQITREAAVGSKENWKGLIKKNLISNNRDDVRHLRPGSQKLRFVAVGQANATGEDELKSVADELTGIEQLVDGLATFTRIEGPECSISRAVDEFSKNEWVHLACHGIPNENQPFDSAFALHDGHLTIEHIIQCELENAEFAYLSACHTTVGDKDSPDEALHLAAAMQFVGFRSVIGTMWAVDDGQTSKITSTFYRHMVSDSGRLDYTRAALALHLTMKELTGIVPGDQRILYVHIGA